MRRACTVGEIRARESRSSRPSRPSRSWGPEGNVPRSDSGPGGRDLQAGAEPGSGSGSGSGGGSYDSRPSSFTSMVSVPSPETQRCSWRWYGSMCQPQTTLPLSIPGVYRLFAFLSLSVHAVHLAAAYRPTAEVRVFGLEWMGGPGRAGPRRDGAGQGERGGDRPVQGRSAVSHSQRRATSASSAGRSPELSTTKSASSRRSSRLIWARMRASASARSM